MTITPRRMRLFAMACALAVDAHALGQADNQGPERPLVTAASQLRQVANRDLGSVCSFDFQGTVLAADRKNGVIFLQHESGAEALEVAFQEELLPGQRIRLKGTNYVSETEIGVSLGARPVLDNDGLHPPIRKSVSIDLRAGRHPIRVAWFNRTATSVLRLTYAGPNQKLAPIPDAALFQKGDGSHSHTDEIPNGLYFRCFEGSWECLPDFGGLTPVKQGVTANVDLSVKTREEDVGLTFDGYIQLTSTGQYTFSLESDDGSRLFLEHEPPLLTTVGEGNLTTPRRIFIGQTLAVGQGPFWSEVDGMVTFIKPRRNGEELEILSNDSRMRILVLAERDKLGEQVLHRRVAVRGVCHLTANAAGEPVAGLLVVPNWNEVRLLEGASDAASDQGNASQANLPLLTTAAQVQELKRTKPEMRYPVKLRGVVTWTADNHESLVLQDATRAVFVWMGNNRGNNPPKTHDYLEVEGRSAPGQFSPLVNMRRWTRLGVGQFPSPVIATWSDLVVGSLDSQWVEIRGYVTAASSKTMTLLLPGGFRDFNLSPAPGPSPERFLKSVVRIRGCLFANWDPTTHEFSVNRPIRMGNATIMVETPPPADPFAGDRVRSVDLRKFEAKPDFFRSVKLTGQILHGNGATYFVTDEGAGLRLQLASPVQFDPGDHVEMVGMVDLEGSVPLLREAVARRIGQSPLPSPKALDLMQLAASEDATRVWVEGVLVAVKDTGRELTMELQSGLKNYVARLQSKERPPAPWRVGSRLRLVGVFTSEGSQRERSHVSSFELLIHSPDDVVVTDLPPWWTARRIAIIIGVLVAGLGLAVVWIHMLRRQVERRTALLKREIAERERAEEGRAIEEERSRIARDIHDEVGSNLTKISKLAELMDRQGDVDEAHEPFSRTIAETAHDTVQAMDAIVWAVNPRNDSLEEMANYLVHLSQEFLRPAGISCCLDVPLGLPDIPVSAEVRHNLSMVVKEALNNAVKHAAARQIKLRLEVKSDELTIQVSDNGLGFRHGAASSIRNGLGNMRKRMMRLGGALELQSEPGRGTTVTLQVSLGSKRSDCFRHGCGRH
jgi:signal transduction histidine kinase